MDILEISRGIYPRVSHIISKQNESEMRAIPLEALANASIRGTAIHEYCSSYLNKIWIPEVQSEYVPYFEAFKYWADCFIADIVLCDTRFYDDDLKFSGEVDVIYKDKQGLNVLLDIKTSAKYSRAWPIQLAAYNHLCQKNDIQIDRAINLHLRKDYSKDKSSISVTPVVIEPLSLSGYWDVFQSAIACYNYFEMKGEINVKS